MSRISVQTHLRPHKFQHLFSHHCQAVHHNTRVLHLRMACPKSFFRTNCLCHFSQFFDLSLSLSHVSLCALPSQLLFLRRNVNDPNLESCFLSCAFDCSTFLFSLSLALFLLTLNLSNWRVNLKVIRRHEKKYHDELVQCGTTQQSKHINLNCVFSKISQMRTVQKSIIYRHMVR